MNIFFYGNLPVRWKIILPILLVSILSGIGLYLFFTQMYEEQATNNLISQARTLVLEAEAAREYTSEQIQHNVFKDTIKNVDDLLRTVPIFSAIRVAKKKAHLLGLEVKVPKFSPRNPDNTPDSYESSVLKNFETNNIDEFYSVDESTNKLRYLRPVRLTKECLKCHGDPAQSVALWGNDNGLDPTGTKMEGWKEGEVHGALEVLMPLAPIQSNIRKQSTDIALIALFTSLLLTCIGWLIAIYISKRIKQIENASLKVANGDLTTKIPITNNDEIGNLSIAFNMMVDTINNSELEKQSYVKQSVETVLEAMTRFANGDLTVRITRDESGIIGTLYHGFNDAVKQIQDLVHRVLDATGATTIAAHQIGATTNQIATTMDAQVLQANQVATAIEEMSSAINENTRSVTLVNSEAENTNNIVEETKKIFDGLVKRSDSIGQVMDVISDIAEQTNLLALNASIEAARAGDHGRGFAVVADEIRKLAEKTQMFTKQIVESVRGIQSDTNESKEYLKEVTHRVSSMTDLISQIATSSEEQSVTSRDISLSVNTMTNGFQQTSNTISEFTKTAEELSLLTSNLTEVVQKFTTS